MLGNNINPTHRWKEEWKHLNFKNNFFTTMFKSFWTKYKYAKILSFLCQIACKALLIVFFF